MHHNHNIELQTIFTSIHDAVLYAVKNGKSATYLSPDPASETDDGSKPNDDQAPSIGHVSILVLFVCLRRYSLTSLILIHVSSVYVLAYLSMTVARDPRVGAGAVAVQPQ